LVQVEPEDDSWGWGTYFMIFFILVLIGGAGFAVYKLKFAENNDDIPEGNFNIKIQDMTKSD